MAETQWGVIADDLEVARVSVTPQSVLSPELFLIRTSLKSYRVGVIRAADFGMRRDNVRDLSNRANSILAVNANFFDEHGKALGLVISRGIKHQNIHHGGGTITGIFQLTQLGPAILNRADFKPKYVLEALQAGPRLVVNNKRVTTIKEPDKYSRRAGVCIDKRGRLVIYISSGLMGISINQVQDILLKSDIDCANALNLDGGSSAQLYLNASLLNTAYSEVNIQGRDNVPVALGLFKRVK